MEGPEVSRTPAAAFNVRVFLLMLGFAAAVVGLATWLIPRIPEGSWMRWAAWGAVPFVVYLGSRLIRGPRSSKLRRR
jgi:hypothetical protein